MIEERRESDHVIENIWVYRSFHIARSAEGYILVIILNLQLSKKI